MSVTRGNFLKQLGKSLPGMIMGSGAAVAAQKLIGKMAAASGEPITPVAPDPALGSAKPFTPRSPTFEFIKHGPPRSNRVALTFDDGPVPGVTDLILDELKTRNLRATFFMIGERIAAAPDLARRVLAEGHEVGNHTYSHPNLTTLPDAEVDAQIEKTQEVMRNLLNHRPSFFRPPFGGLRQNQAGMLQKRGLRAVLWDVDSKDWSQPATEKITENILNQVRAGSIILCHDLRAQTAASAGPILDGLLERKLDVATLSRLLM
jgi:peptidoglycan/xylan/chitin deacetylase (PgdA/CDA1 family)